MSACLSNSTHTPCGNRLWLFACPITLGVLTEGKLCSSDWGTVVAGGDERFQPQLVEVGGKVLEEVALKGIVTVAVDDLASESFRIELE